MEKKLLTICIPTYNRSVRLKKLVEQIVFQTFQKFDNQVSVFISDNSSIDDTQEICNSFVNQYNFISYNRFETNKGFDANYEFLFSNSRTKFVLILSDDDFLMENSLSKIVAFLTLHDNINACFLNNVSFQGNYEAKNKCFSPFLKIDNDCVVDSNQFVSIVGTSFSFISSMILNKNFFDGRNLKQYFGTMWMGSYAFLSCITNSNDKFGIISEPLIAYHITQGLFNYDFYQVFGPNKKEVIKTFSKETTISRKLLFGLYRKGSKNVLSVISKEKVLKNKHLFKRFYPYFRATFMYPEMWPIFLTLFLPSWMWIWIRKLFKKKIKFN